MYMFLLLWFMLLAYSVCIYMFQIYYIIKILKYYIICLFHSMVLVYCFLTCSVYNIFNIYHINIKYITNVLLI